MLWYKPLDISFLYRLKHLYKWKLYFVIIMIYGIINMYDNIYVQKMITYTNTANYRSYLIYNCQSALFVIQNTKTEVRGIPRPTGTLSPSIV